MSSATSADSSNGLVCFTNCLLAQEDGSLIQKDLWVDGRRGVIVDAQRTFFLRKERPDTVVDLGGNILSPGLIDVQINGAYNFDFSVYDGDDEAYRAGMDMIARRIVETGVTALLPTIITQESTLYPHLLHLLRPRTPSPTPEFPHGGATLLGWHAEGPFLQSVKRGAHAQALLQPAAAGIPDVERVYGANNLAVREDWELTSAADATVSGAGVRVITLAPELPGILAAIGELSQRGVIVSIGHSVASADTAARAVRRGARMVTHLFNAMPQLHHRDPGIIGLLGASPASLTSIDGGYASGCGCGNGSLPSPVLPDDEHSGFAGETAPDAVTRGTMVSSEGAEALGEHDTPPHTPVFRASSGNGAVEIDDEKPVDTRRPFYGMIVDGVHSHPNSVRLAYTAHKDGCVLVTDAMKILDPNMPDGTYEWRDDRRVVKEGVRLFIEGTDTLAGSVVTLNTCVRNFARFTGCTLGEAIRCATYNPAKCLGIENRKGTLRAGADADLVVLDHQGAVLSTWVHGQQVWSRIPTQTV